MKPSSPPAHVLPSSSPSPAGFDRSGGSSITAGCFLGATAEDIPLLCFSTCSSVTPDASTISQAAASAISRKHPNPGAGRRAPLRGNVQEKQAAGRKTGVRRKNQYQGSAQDHAIKRRETGDKNYNSVFFGNEQWHGCPPDINGGDPRYSSHEEDDGRGTSILSGLAEAPGVPQSSVVVRAEDGSETDTTKVKRPSGSKRELIATKYGAGSVASSILPSEGFRFPVPYPTPLPVDMARSSSLLNQGGPSFAGGIRTQTSENKSPSNRLRQQQDEHNKNGEHTKSEKHVLSRRLDGIMAAYSAHQPPTKQMVFGKRGSVRGSKDDTYFSSEFHWRQTIAAERIKQLEDLMDAAMESPVTYEEQIRRERLTHLRMLYTVRRNASLMDWSSEKEKCFSSE